MNTALISSESKDLPILIVDRRGEIGRSLADKLKNESLVVFVSKVYQDPDENIIHIPFNKKIPSIPDNKYSYIFLIDEENEILESTIKPFLKKAEQDNAPFIFCVNKKNIDKAKAEETLSSYPNARVVVLGDIFAKEKIYESKNEINQFISDVKTRGRITIQGDGIREVYPVFLEDTINAILESIFGDYENEKIFLAYSPKGLSLLKIASIFKKINPNIGIDYEKEKNAKSIINASIEGKYLIREDYDLEEKLRKIDFNEVSVLKLKEMKIPNNQISNYNYFWFILIFLLFIIIFPFIIMFVSNVAGTIFLYSAGNNLNLDKNNLVKTQAQISSNFFSLTQDSIRFAQKELSLFGKENMLFDFYEKTNEKKHASDLLVSSVSIYEASKNIIEQNSQNPQNDFSFVYSQSQMSFFIYQKLLQNNIFPKNITSSLSDSMKIFSSTINFWPDLFGFNGKRTYAILFDNSLNLRSGGGEITSYATFSLEKGRIMGFNIHKTSEANSLLRTRFEPPFAIRRYLPSTHWYLKDSNFDVDFSKSAIASANFINSETGLKLDGIISIDSFFIKDMVSFLGGISLPNLSENITSDNLFKQISVNAGKDILDQSYQLIFAKIAQDKHLNLLSFLNILVKSIYEKHILFAFSNQNMQAAFSLNGFSSALVDNRMQDSDKINDFIGISEFNLGENNINYYITRSLSQDVSIGADGKISEKVTISFKNSADSIATASANYKTYLRVIVPLDVNIDSIVIDGKEQKIISAIKDPSVYEKKGFIPPVGLEVEKYNQGKNTIYGFLVNVDAGVVKTINISYFLPKKINISDPELTYSLKIFKQPGISFLPYQFSLDFPKNIKVIDSSKGLYVSQENVSLTSQVVKDGEVIISLGQR